MIRRMQPMYARSRRPRAPEPEPDEEEELDHTDTPPSVEDQEEEPETEEEEKDTSREARRKRREEEDRLLDALEDFADLVQAPGYKPPTPTEMLVLKAIAIQTKPATFVLLQNFLRAIRPEDQEETLVQINPHLKSLLERGLIKVDKSKAGKGGKPRNLYSVTPRGAKATTVIENFLRTTQKIKT